MHQVGTGYIHYGLSSTAPIELHDAALKRSETLRTPQPWQKPGTRSTPTPAVQQ